MLKIIHKFPAIFVPGYLAIACVVAGLTVLTADVGPHLIRPGDRDWPRVWMTYSVVNSVEADFADLKAHGVGLVSCDASTPAKAREWLEIGRRLGMKYHIGFPEITESRGIIDRHHYQRVDALMIGGVYQGKAIDRHLFTFTAARHAIIIEPPVYAKKFSYSTHASFSGPGAEGEPIGHYFPDMPAPVRAEVVVPLRPYDGKQHLKIIPVQVETAPPDARPENDSVTPDMPVSSETANRRLYRLTFDLTGLESAMLDKIGIAVYWDYPGTNKYWIFGQGDASAAAETTRMALQDEVKRIVGVWKEANGGAFPTDEVLAARWGDECFYVTGHVSPDGPAVSYPLWDYSAPAIDAFAKHAGAIEYPRTWGFPEIYGAPAYAWWMYSLHENCARLGGAIREEISRDAPGLLLFRNTTRFGVFSISNDHDGSGPELLTQNLDIAHLDPYPVSGTGYKEEIPRDMSYYSGLARRYHRILIPWMQAHTYGGPNGLQNPTPEEIDRMADEQYQQGVDAVIWLAYGKRTEFPLANPASWERAAAFARRLESSPPPKPMARLAVLRSYNAWSLSCEVDGGVRNPTDWLLQQMLEVWAVNRKQPYDVFELPPVLSSAERASLEKMLKKYPFVVSTTPWKRAWVIGADAESTTVDLAKTQEIQSGFEKELIRRGWLQAQSTIGN